MTAPIDFTAIAARVNQRLAAQAKPGAMPEVVSARRVEIVLANATGRHFDLIRAVAAEVEEEGAK